MHQIKTSAYFYEKSTNIGHNAPLYFFIAVQITKPTAHNFGYSPRLKYRKSVGFGYIYLQWIVFVASLPSVFIVPYPNRKIFITKTGRSVRAMNICTIQIQILLFKRLFGALQLAIYAPIYLFQLKICTMRTPQRIWRYLTMAWHSRCKNLPESHCAFYCRASA